MWFLIRRLCLCKRSQHPDIRSLRTCIRSLRIKKRAKGNDDAERRESGSGEPKIKDSNTIKARVRAL
jgi:hypothetical protein